MAFAKANGLPLSIRGGGHNVAGAALSDGGVTIDMSQRRAVTVDPARKTVKVEAGATWKDVDAVTQPHGLIVPSGLISATGVAGFTLGAGFGWTSRKFGFAADNLVAADVVTTDGKVLRASADENIDLFWALRGGGGNFAVVTDFTFRAHSHGPQVLAGMAVHPFDRVDEVIRLFRNVTQSSPDESRGCWFFAERRRHLGFRRSSMANLSPASLPIGQGKSKMASRRCGRSRNSASPSPIRSFRRNIRLSRHFSTEASRSGAATTGSRTRPEILAMACKPH